MNITDFSTELFCRIDDALPDAPRHSQAIPSISELVAIGVLQAMKPVSQRACYPWLRDNYGHLCSPNCRSGPVWGAGGAPTTAGPATFRPSPPSWDWRTALAWNCAIPYGRAAAAPDQSARKASPISAGSSAASSVSRSTGWA